MNLKKLKQQWYQRLKDDGFNDIEHDDGSLKTYDRRTVAFENRVTIMEFFLELDRYLNSTELKNLDKQILIMYSDGMKITDIGNALGFSRQWITKIIKKHKINIGYGFQSTKIVTNKYILRKRESKST